MSLPQLGTQERYAGRPFLRLVDAYLLQCIGHLAEPQAASICQMAPRLAVTFGSSETQWERIVEQQLGYSPEVAGEIQALWAGYQEQSERQGVPADPAVFVYRFVADNVAGA